LLRIGEQLELRGPEVDRLHGEALAAEREKTIAHTLAGLEGMTLTVVDGDFPREVMAGDNVMFASYSMEASQNRSSTYDTKLFGPAPEAGGKLHQEKIEPPEKPVQGAPWKAIGAVFLAALLIGYVAQRRKAPRP
jgi:hypothetical protein